MPTVDDFADYPKGTVSQGAGDCVDVTDWAFDGEDGEKIVSTLRQNPAGSTFGTRSGKLTFTSAISHAGFERDWFGKWMKREVVEIRLKLPGLTISITGRLSGPGATGSVDDFIKCKFMVIGKPSFALV